MNLLEIMPALGPARGTSPWTWSCWGTNAQYIDWGGADNHIASCVFDRATGLVYCLELYTGVQAIRYIEQAYQDAYREECLAQGIDYQQPHEGIEFVNVDNPQAIMALLATLPTNQTPTNDPT